MEMLANAPEQPGSDEPQDAEVQSSATRNVASGWPAAKQDCNVTSEANGEFLVYDPQSTLVHHLSNPMMSVWRQCDGNRTPDEIATNLALDLVSVEFCLEQLSRVRLIHSSTVG